MLKRSKGSRTILLALVLIAVGATAFIIMSANKAASGHGNPTVKESPKQLVALDEFVVNLADKREAHYLKVQMVLEMRGEKAKEEVSHLKPEVRDKVISVLSGKSYYELLEPKGKEHLKEQVKESLDEVFEESTVTGIFFNSFAMQ